MSVGARGVFNAAYEPLLFEVDTIPFPAAGQEQRTLDAFERLARDREVAALIVEPLVLGGRRHARVPRLGTRRTQAHCRALGDTFHRRRSHDRLGRHRHNVCLRAGRDLEVLTEFSREIGGIYRHRHPVLSNLGGYRQVPHAAKDNA
ncbi:hypothetical protein MPL3356_270006 [Mesorhizobium plurifarium]|uniref:Uncharacterized protein n=1 Tax=Mesorhizobium plurifarium TaxID=69974 RepID=A0A090DP34_MESPL|nr:hypothetical protein MPL3356_270006 [Mesorhizobium plurifarium]